MRPAIPPYGRAGLQRCAFGAFIPGRHSSRDCKSSPDASVKPLLSIKAAQRHRHLLAPPRRPFRAAGCSRPGCWRRQCQASQICSPAFAFAQNPRCLPQTARSARINGRTSYQYSKGIACSRAPSSPAPPSYRAHSFEPSRLRRNLSEIVLRHYDPFGFPQRLHTLPVGWHRSIYLH